MHTLGASRGPPGEVARSLVVCLLALATGPINGCSAARTTMFLYGGSTSEPPAWMRAPDPRRRLAGLAHLTRWPRDPARRWLPALILTEPRGDVRRAAWRASSSSGARSLLHNLLGELHRADLPSARDLLVLLADVPADVIRRDASAVLAVLVDRLAEPPKRMPRGVADLAITVLTRLGPDSVHHAVATLADRRTWDQETATLERRLARWLRRLGDPGTTRLLDAWASTEEDSPRDAAAALLGHLGDAVVDRVSSMLSDAFLGKSAGQILVTIGAPARPALYRILLTRRRDEEGEAFTRDIARRGNAAAALSRLAGTLDVPLLNRLLVDGSTDERNAAARALRRLKDPRGLMALLQGLHRCAWICTAGREYEAPLLRAIRAFGSSAVPGLVAMLADESDERREDAARILGELGDRRAVIRLIDLLYDHHPGVAIAAFEALCSLGDPRAAPYLVRKLRSTPLPPPLYHWLLLARQPDPTARKAVLAYLRRQQREESLYYLLLNLGIGGPGGGPSVTAALLRYLVHPSERVSNTALWALGRLRDRSVAPRLRARLASTGPVQRRRRLRLIGALGRIGGPRQITVLKRIASRRDDPLRSYAVAAWLRAMGATKDPIHPARWSGGMLPGPRVWPRSTSRKPGPPSEVLERALASSNEALLGCYLDALLVRPTLRTKLTAEWSATTSGRITLLSLKGGAPATLRRCVSGVMNKSDVSQAAAQQSARVELRLDIPDAGFLVDDDDEP